MKRAWRIAINLMSILVLVGIPVSHAWANDCPSGMSQLDCSAINGNWVNWVPDNGSSSCNLTPINGTAGDEKFTLDQVKTFASEPMTSTWNISDSTVEQWFLKQPNAQAKIAAYNITASNIHTDISEILEKYGVSPVFYYLYGVNEGAGGHGLINHWEGEITNDLVTDITADANYLANDVSKGGYPPATGGGEPDDLPTDHAKPILDAMPPGSIGKAYIPSTSAVTAELEYLSGHKGDWNPGDQPEGKTPYGSPLTTMMENIVKMGGNPLQGGATISSASSDCTGGVTGEGMEKAISWAVTIANNDGYGYSLDGRETGWSKWQSDPSCTKQCGSFDCSSLVAAALTEAGYFQPNPQFTTSGESDALEGIGFTKVASSATTSTGLQRGDILYYTASPYGHTAIYLGNNQIVEAASEFGHPEVGDQGGDSHGGEIRVRDFYNDGWTGVYRAPS